MTHITSTRIRSHRPLALPRRKIPPTTAQTGGRRRSYNFTLSGPGGNPRSRLEDWNPNFGLQPCTVRMRILTTLLYPKSPPADGFVTRPDPAQTRQGWLRSIQVLRRSRLRLLIDSRITAPYLLQHAYNSP